jgi:alpha-amylase
VPPPADAAGDIREAQGQPVAGRGVPWLSSDPGFVTVSSAGVVTGVRAGRATITVIADGAVADLLVLVYAEGLHVWPDTLALLPGATRQVTARSYVRTALPVVLSGATWASSNPAVARVDSAGLATAVVGGHATARTGSAERVAGQ